MYIGRKGPVMRVLHIMSGYGGGISTFIHNIASSIQAYGILFDVVTYDEVPESFRQVIQVTGGDVYQLNNPKKHGWRSFKASFTRVMDLYQYDLVHCHIAGYRAYIYKQLAQAKGIQRFVVHAHYSVDESQLHPFERLRHQIDQQVNRYVSDAYIGCSRMAIKSLYGYAIPNQQMMVIPNSIDPDEYLLDAATFQAKRDTFRQNHGLTDDDFVIGQIGRLAPGKNHRLTLEVASHARLQGLAGRFFIAGAGALEADLQQEIRSRSLEGRVVMLGRVSPIADFFPALDCLIFPSKSEGLGTVAIESQAAGIPVVMSNTIPREADLGLGLVKRTPLTADAETWYKALKEAKQRNIPSVDQRMEALEKHNYTNDEAARLYTLYLREALPSAMK